MPRKKADAYKEKPLPQIPIIIDADKPPYTGVGVGAEEPGPGLPGEKPAKLPAGHVYTRTGPATEAIQKVDTKHGIMRFDKTEKKAIFPVPGEQYFLYISNYSAPPSDACRITMEYIGYQLTAKGLDDDNKLDIDLHDYMEKLNLDSLQRAKDRFLSDFAELKNWGLSGPIKQKGRKGKVIGQIDTDFFASSKEVYFEENGGQTGHIKIGVMPDYYRVFDLMYLTAMNVNLLKIDIKVYPHGPEFGKTITNWARMNSNDKPHPHYLISVDHIVSRAHAFPTRTKRGIQKGTRGKLGAVLKKEQDQAGPVLRYGQQVLEPFINNMDLVGVVMGFDWWWADKNGNQVDEPRSLDEFEKAYICHTYTYPIPRPKRKSPRKPATGARKRKAATDKTKRPAQAS